ncbi:DUF1304 domain-containing protein [Alkalicoccobacillus plakortidis]|uniref:DUF1304 domain-containing protein n=1 Tax=Alkalicoccobacillus plakortidis TaxID=444060 RepID=A0ABT0XNR6_9BACI|nr:DUF1304 domain-containing protein [Alkalicoccobacillus plakortidis]MCM2677511.1 DUF1304 domain-containing protein [Alkalicoccobacillus plakortidis]
MSVVSTVLVMVVALEHLYIMYLETFATSSSRTSKTFNIDEEKLMDPTVNVLLKNQGIYNGFLALALIYAALFSNHALEISTLLVIVIIGVAIYGGLTSSKSIILKQGGPAILALLSIVIFN